MINTINYQDFFNQNLIASGVSRYNYLLQERLKNQKYAAALTSYNKDKFNSDLTQQVQLNPFTKQKEFFSSLTPDFTQPIKDKLSEDLSARQRSVDVGLGLALQSTPNTAVQQLGKQIADENLEFESLPDQSPTTTIVPEFSLSDSDVSDLTGSNINYKEQFAKKGSELALSLATSLDGKAANVAANAIKAGSTIYDAASNIKKINSAMKDGVEGLGKAKAGNAIAIVGAVSDLAGSFLPDKSEYEGPKGDITKTIDSVYDGISNAAMSFGPVGMIVGGAMKGANLLNRGMNALGGGTDAMTAQDAILGSSFFGWNIGLINGFGGKKADTITKDLDAFSTVGSSYTSSELAVDSALQKSGKKYGLFSSGARKEANEEIAEAKRQQNIIGDISELATNRFDIMNAMSSINSNRRAFQLKGGYNQSSVRVGREGMTIPKVIVDSTIISEIPELILDSINGFKEGGKLSHTSTIGEIELLLDCNYINEIEFVDSIGLFKEGGTLEESPENKQEAYIQYALERFPILSNLERINLQYDPNFNPKSIGDYGDLEYIESKYNDLPYYHNYPKDEKYKGKSVIVYNDKVDKEDIALDWLSHGLREHDSNWQDILNILGNDPVWRRKINDQLFGRYLQKLKMTNFENLPEFIKASLIQEFDKQPVDEENFNSELDGLIRGIITRNRDTYAPIEEYEDIINTPSWKIAARYLFGNNPEKYAEGGKFNVIPEGALHARLHHMDNDENITKKGIPVVSEKENGEIEQQAEIEREEIILRLSLTKKLEELAKEDTDEAAIEAGKILVREIFENTIDNTNTFL